MALGAGGGEVLKGAEGGPGTQKFVYQKCPKPDFPFRKLRFSHDGHFGLGGAGGARDGIGPLTHTAVRVYPRRYPPGYHCRSADLSGTAPCSAARWAAACLRESEAAELAVHRQGSRPSGSSESQRSLGGPAARGAGVSAWVTWVEHSESSSEGWTPKEMVVYARSAPTVSRRTRSFPWRETRRSGRCPVDARCHTRQHDARSGAAGDHWDR